MTEHNLRQIVYALYLPKTPCHKCSDHYGYGGGCTGGDGGCSTDGGGGCCCTGGGFLYGDGGRSALLSGRTRQYPSRKNGSIRSFGTTP